MGLMIDIQVEQVQQGVDMDALAAYLSAALKEETGTQVQAHIIESDYTNAISLAQQLKMQKEY